MSSIEIRSVTPDDAERLREIYAPYVKDTAVSFEYDVPSLQEFRGRIERTLERYPYICAVREGVVMGYAYAGPFHAREAYQWSAELSIYVDGQAHGQGIGRRLYEELEKRLREQGIVNTYAGIAVPTVQEDEYLTAASERFHARMGFKEVARFRDCGKKFGRWYSMIYMEKIIGTHD